MPTTRELANAIRILSIDAIQKANSGHPGMPLGMADIATVLWREFLRHDPNTPKWQNRDRFILSNGHGSMLHYSLLHLTGYNLTIDDIKQFRQLNSKTPGHPEYGHTDGIEVTTGPLGQGLANAVGTAIAEKVLAAQFNRPNLNIVDHYTYVFAGDGCLMEGISHEACSLAGTLGLGKLIVFWDDNGISIDGHTSGWFTDNTPQRFEAYGWHTITNVDAYNAADLRKAITEAQAVTDKPSIICCKTIIGFGAPNVCGLHDCHGSPLGAEEISATRKNLDWPYPPFVIPDEIYQAWNAKAQGNKNLVAWQKLLDVYFKQYPELAAEFMRRITGTLPANWSEKNQQYLDKVDNKKEGAATRKASQNWLEEFSPIMPEFLGGSADLTASNLTNWSGSKDITKADFTGNYLHYGVREFGMAAIMNGIAVYGAFIPYGGTFLVFSDYARNAIRLAAMMKCRTIFVLSHDSIGLGEDGPTHQPIEHLGSLRMIPNLTVWRPCDGVETAAAWQAAIENNQGPTCLALSRQKVPAEQRNAQTIANVKCGGYIIQDCATSPECILIATGSEVALAVNAAKSLQQLGKRIRVISMPSTEVFDTQDEAYKEQVLPAKVTTRVAIEAGSSDGWYKYVGLQGKILGINQFGKSAPEQEIYKSFGLTTDNIVKVVTELLIKDCP